MSEGAFFQDLAWLMTVAGLVSAFCSRFNLPKVIGYIFAGVMLNEYTFGGAFLVDANSVKTIGQLGVVFLMFSMGLEFSTRAMKRLKFVAAPAAVFDTVVMTWLGYTVGSSIFGWGLLPSLCLGAAICDSATTMLAKVIGELRWSDRPFVKYALGTSVCEDLVCVGIIALVTGVGAGKGLSLSSVGMSLGGLFVFLLAVIVFGLVLVPRLLKSVEKRKDDEALLLTVLGCCFFISYFAYRFNFSLAVGAFLVGILGASSDVRRKLVDFVSPLKSMFAAVFFISIGLLVNPKACLDHWAMILLLSVVVVVGKSFNCTLAALVAGEKVKTAVQMGLSLAQIGEFAFMVALIYANLADDWKSPMYQVVVAVSILTTVLNPLLIRKSEAVGDWAEAHVTGRFRRAYETYRAFVLKYREGRELPEERQAVRRSLVRLVVIAVLTFAVSFVCGALPKHDFSNFSVFFEKHDDILFFLLANVFALVMLPMVLLHAKGIGDGVAKVMTGPGEAKWMLALRSVISRLMLLAIVALFFFDVFLINVNLAPKDKTVRWIVSGVLVVTAVVGWRAFTRLGTRAVSRFNESLGAEEREEKLSKMLTVKIPEGVYQPLLVAADSPAVGGTVVTLNIRARTGASIVSVKRGEEIIRQVGPELVFQAGDELIAIGKPSQIDSLRQLLTPGSI